DIVCFIHSPQNYLRSYTDASGNDIRGLAEFIIAKHRSGSVDDVKMRFRAKYARFENWDDGMGFDEQTVGSGMNAVPLEPGSAPLSGGTADFMPGPADEPAPF
ncbi:MAG: DnaB-like helicase C-terminal domain-containing protein, partial [Muribaculaceae bacterium]|nr:DnaB-like helicase C-terminal domain-containing protein [Muribaculaceae bacterium]